MKFILPSFYLFSIPHSNVMHRKVCVKGFSGPTAPRILEFGTNFGYDYFYGVRQNQHPHVYHCLYLSISLILQHNFFSKISYELLHLGF